MTEYTHEQIAALLAGITQGEWECAEFRRWAEWGQPDPPPVWEVDGPDYALGNAPHGSYDNQADAEFIAAAPAIVAQLLDYQLAYEAIKPDIDRLQEMKITEYGENVVNAAVDKIAQLLARVEALEAENKALRTVLNSAGEWIAGAEIANEPGFDGSTMYILRTIEGALKSSTDEKNESEDDHAS